MNNQIIGHPQHKNVGMNYENNLFEKKLHLTSSYNFSNNGMVNESAKYNSRIVNDNQTQETMRESTSENDNRRHVLRSRIHYRIDCISNLNIRLDVCNVIQSST